MNNKMAKHTNLSTIKSKQTKQKRTETASWIENILLAARWEGNVGELGEEVRGLRSTNK